jgi:hypothetical protein
MFDLNRSPLELRAGAHVFCVRMRRCVLAAACLATVTVASTAAGAQITVDTRTGKVTNVETGRSVATVDRRYQQIKPTDVPLTKSELDPKTRLELIRLMQAEQGFAMRPFPRGHKGLTLVANGKLEPAGEGYLNMATSEGLCAVPGDRLVLTDLKIDHNKIVFDINGGPDQKHRFLRHVQLGTGGATNPVVQGEDPQATGARLTLQFEGRVPELTGKEVKALLAPLISFDVKTPVQAFTDTLPTTLKDAIMNHHVLVGMSTDMLLYAKGQPVNKSREMDGQMPFEEWMYGKPPEEVDFVRINGNRVIRVEVAKMGEPPVVYTKDVVEGLMRTDGTALEPSTTRVAKMGDVERDPNTQSPTAPPSLRKAGETLPQDDDKNREGPMKPVQFPKQKPDDAPVAHAPAQPGANPGANPDGEPASDATGTPAANSPTAAPAPAKPQQLVPSALTGKS